MGCESSEDYHVGGSYPSTGVYGNKGFDCHWHVDDDSVSRSNIELSFHGASQSLAPTMELFKRNLTFLNEMKIVPFG